MTMPVPQDEPGGHVQTNAAVAAHQCKGTVCPSCHKAELQHVRVTECPSCGFRKVESEDEPGS